MSKKLSAGDWVEVRSKEEILRTLDSKGELDGMPFMPEMFQFCGMRFQVYKRAHKTCDYATPYPYHTRWLSNSVHLQTRCDGAGHSNCQAGCLINWKEAWLKPVAKDSQHGVLTQIETSSTKNSAAPVGCTEGAVRANTQVVDANGALVKYKCQA